MLKRIAALILIFLMATTSLVGCGNNAENITEEPSNSSNTSGDQTTSDDSKPYAGTTIRVLSANQTCVEQVIYPALDEFYDLTGITVEMEIMGTDDFANKAAIELAGQSSNLDVIFLRPLESLKQYVQNGWLTDLIWMTISKHPWRAVPMMGCFTDFPSLPRVKLCTTGKICWKKRGFLFPQIWRNCGR